MRKSDTKDSDTYEYLVLAVPKTIAVPYKLHSGKTTTTIKPLVKAKEVVACPYLTQAKRLPVLVELFKKVDEVADTVFKNLSVFLPLQTIYKEFPGFRCMIIKWDCCNVLICDGSDGH